MAGNQRASVKWVAHASRVLATVSRRRELSFIAAATTSSSPLGKVRFGATPKPTRETRALPRIMLAPRIEPR
ncbi:MAG: hypothetical protein DME54_09140 [Verrucomicrobia bacterium]|nr:MAG: hypothetical protein DMF09_12370 [Verrucomicrobiota bacterium]PYK34199.1 MAG: hypothetical protein DME54_09140 [Verrucomicrobiota bacterium]